MLTLLEPSDLSLSAPIDMDLERFLTALTEETKKVRDYERTSGHFVAGNHPLIKMLQGFEVNLEKDPMITYTRTKAIETEIGHAYGICTYSSMSDVTSDFFYPCKELMIIDRSSPSLSEVRMMNEKQNWLDITPVKTVSLPLFYHPLQPPKGDFRTVDDTEVSVISVHLPLLAMMYHNWLLQNEKLDAGTQETHQAFISRYVIPNMMESQVHAYVLRTVWEVMSELPSMIDDFDGALFVRDFHDELTKEYGDFIDNLRLSKYEETEYLSVLPSVFDKSIYQGMVDLEAPNSAYNLGTTVAAYHKAIDLVMKLGEQQGRSGRRFDKLRSRLVRQVKGKRAFNYIADKPLAEELRRWFTRVLEE